MRSESDRLRIMMCVCVCVRYVSACRSSANGWRVFMMHVYLWVTIAQLNCEHIYLNNFVTFAQLFVDIERTLTMPRATRDATKSANVCCACVY